MLILINKKTKFLCYDQKFRYGINLGKGLNHTLTIDVGFQNRQLCLQKARRLAIRHNSRIVELNVADNDLMVLADGILRCNKGKEQKKYDRKHIGQFVLFDSSSPFERCVTFKDQSEILIEMISEKPDLPLFERMQTLSLLKQKIDFEMGNLREQQNRINVTKKRPKIRAVKPND